MPAAPLARTPRGDIRVTDSKAYRAERPCPLCRLPRSHGLRLALVWSRWRILEAFDAFQLPRLGVDGPLPAGRDPHESYLYNASHANIWGRIVSHARLVEALHAARRHDDCSETHVVNASVAQPIAMQSAAFALGPAAAAVASPPAERAFYQHVFHGR